MSEDKRLKILNDLHWIYLLFAVVNFWSFFNILFTDLVIGTFPSDRKIIFDISVQLYSVLFLLLGLSFLVGFWGIRYKKSWSYQVVLTIIVVYITSRIVIAYQSFFLNENLGVALFEVVAVVFWGVLLSFLIKDRSKLSWNQN